MADDLRLFGITGHWSTAEHNPGYSIAQYMKGAVGLWFMAAWVKEGEKASNQRQKKREAEEADEVEVAPGVTVASLRSFRAALIGPVRVFRTYPRFCVRKI